MELHSHSNQSRQVHPRDGSVKQQSERIAKTNRPQRYLKEATRVIEAGRTTHSMLRYMQFLVYTLLSLMISSMCTLIILVNQSMDPGLSTRVLISASVSQPIEECHILSFALLAQ